MSIPAFDTPLEVSTVEGEVAITGPDGLCASFTVEAARASARRILAAVDEISGHDDGETYQKPLG